MFLTSCSCYVYYLVCLVISLDKGYQNSRAIITIIVFALVVLGIYFGYVQIKYDGWDPVAYLYGGERLSQGRGLSLCHTFNGSIGPYFTLAGFNVSHSNPDCLSLNYPLGYPFLLAIVYWMFPLSDVAVYVPVVFSVFGVVLVFVLGGILFDWYTGLIGATILAFLPTYLYFGTSVWADLPAAVLLTLGIVTFVLAEQKVKTSEQILWSSVSATAIGWSIFMRYANVIFLIPVGVYFLASHSFRDILSSVVVRVFVVWIAGILLGVMFFNQVTYGGLFTTPYSPQHGWYSFPAFSFQYIAGDKQSFLAICETLWSNFNVLLLFCVVGVVRMPRSIRLLFSVSILLFILVYSLYAFPARGINERFLLPVFSFVAVSAAFGIRWLSGLLNSRLRRLSLSLGIVFLCVFIRLPRNLQLLEVRNIAAERHVSEVVRAVQKTERDAVLMAYGLNDIIWYYGDRTTFFYRRIPIPGFADTLVDSVNVLLEQDVPMYYVKDLDPSFMGSFEILVEHFILTPVGNETYSVYRILKTDLE